MTECELIGYSNADDFLMLYLKDSSGKELQKKIQVTNYNLRVGDKMTLGSNVVIWKRPGREVTLTCVN